MVPWSVPDRRVLRSTSPFHRRVFRRELTVRQINALMRPLWRSTAVVIVWDDYGGFSDPVAAPHDDIMGLGPGRRR